MAKSIYNSAFYSEYQSDSVRSAREVLTVVNTLINPKSVVDVGCGIGTWLKVWRDFGVDDVKGIDGDYVVRQNLLIPAELFTPMDLTAPARLDAQFDLVQSLEVGEHLPEASAERFVAFLCSLGPVVLFSAAIPHQGGTDHINEQWPDYWAQLFKKQGYLTVDAVRDEVWDNPKVAYYYAQNALLFIKPEGLDRLNPALKPFAAKSSKALSRVHPRRWQENFEKRPALERMKKTFSRLDVHFASRSFRKISTLIKQ